MTTFAKNILKRVGARASEMIEDQIDAGTDIDGKSYAYSTQPFWRPWAPEIVRKLGGKKGEGVFYETIFSKRTGAAGLLILGGYKAYKEKMKPEAAGNFLTWSGKMRRGLKPFEPDSDSVTLGWTDPVVAERAFWLNVSGAGRSRKLWKFLGLTKENQAKLTEEFAPELTGEIARQMAEEIIKGKK